MKRSRTILPFFIAGIILLAVLPAAGRTFRDLDPIQRRGEIVIQQNGRLPLEPQLADSLPAFDAEQVRQAVHELAAAWNTGRLASHLDPGFYNRNRLLETIATAVPKDALLRVVNIRSIQPYDSRVFRAVNDSNRIERVSLVAATVETQIEFNDPQAGWQRLPGTSEFILQVNETFVAGGED